MQPWSCDPISRYGTETLHAFVGSPNFDTDPIRQQQESICNAPASSASSRHQAPWAADVLLHDEVMERISKDVRVKKQMSSSFRDGVLQTNGWWKQANELQDCPGMRHNIASGTKTGCGVPIVHSNEAAFGAEKHV